MSDGLSRPTTIEEMEALFETGGTTEACKLDAQRFQAQPTDIIITPYSKSGTTWLQQIVHGLRSNGDMDFDDISRVVPWIEESYDLGLDIHAPQKWQPRAFKSHADWDTVAKGGRYIVSIRNPKDMFVSSYRFLEGWFFERGTISITAYANSGFLKEAPEEGSGYWHHLLSWWGQRENEQVLLLSFESMRADLPGTVSKVADFIGIPLDDALFEKVVQQASFEFMSAHKDRFDDKLMRELTEKKYNLPSGSDSSKVRKGEVGSHAYELTADLHEAIDVLWQKKIQAELGFESYELFRQVLDQYYLS